MSAVLARTWSYLSGLGQEPGWSVPSPSHTHSLPPPLAAWLQQVSSCVTRAEEAELCQRQIQVVLEKLGQPGVKPGAISDCMVRLLHISLLGYSVSPAYIHCVKLAGTGSLLQRKMGYLACSQLLPPDHQLSLLLTNTILRDLSSPHLPDLQLGLVAASSLSPGHLNSLAPSLLHRLLPLASHAAPQVRTKALAVIHRLCSLEPQLWSSSGAGSVVLGALSDPNPGVVSAALQVAGALVTESEAEAAVAAALHLHSQVQGDKLPLEFLYRGHRAPFLRIHMCRLFHRLHSPIDSSPEWGPQVCAVLGLWLEEALQGRDTVLLALGHEVVLCVALLHCCSSLVAPALRLVSSLLQSRHTSHVYTGLQGLQQLFLQQPPGLSPEQEAAVLACLAHTDPSIQRRTLQLVLVLATRENVCAVLDRIVVYVKSRGEEEGGQVVRQAAELVVRLGKELDWKASTLLRLVQASRGSERARVVSQLKFLLCDPLVPATARQLEPADELELNRVRLKLRDLLNTLVERGVSGGPAPSVVVALSAWCQGRWPSEGALEKLESMGRQFKQHLEVVVAVLRAMQVLLLRGGEEGRESSLAWLEECRGTEEQEVSLVASDVLCLVQLAGRQGSPEVEEAMEEEAPAVRDWSLSFLDTLVVAALERGQQPYRPRSLRESRVKGVGVVAARAQELSLTPYTQQGLSGSVEDSPSLSLTSEEESVPTVWTLGGRLETVQAPRVQDLPQDTGGPKDLENILSDEWS